MASAPVVSSEDLSRAPSHVMAFGNATCPLAARLGACSARILGGSSQVRASALEGPGAARLLPLVDPLPTVMLSYCIF